ncbi:MAG: hypothetical protein N2249_01535 [Melioribacter sp.]|nr:hypothetical protein [Melioribacter sp.]
MKQVKRNSFFIFILISLVLFSCKNKKLDDNIAIRVYVENIIIHEKYSYNQDTLRKYQNELFRSYNISKIDFENYLKSLKTDQNKWQDFFKRAEAYLNELNKVGAVN